MKQLKSLLTRLLIAILVISTGFILICIFSSEGALFKMNCALLATNIAALYPLIFFSRSKNFQLIDPIFLIVLFFAWNYVWCPLYFINSDFYDINGRKTINAITYENEGLIWVFFWSIVLFYVGYLLANKIFKVKNIDLYDIKNKISNRSVVLTTNIYLFLIIFKTFSYATGIVGSAGGNNYDAGLLSLFFAFTRQTVLLYVVIVYFYFKKRISRNQLLFFTVLEFFVIFISGDRRNIFFYIACYAIMYIYYYKHVDIKKLAFYSVLFVAIVWPILNIGNDLANLVGSMDEKNLSLDLVIDYLTGNTHIDLSDNKSTETSGVLRLLFGSAVFDEALLSYDDFYLQGRLLGPVGLLNLFYNILPSFIIPHQDFNYVFLYLQQTLYGTTSEDVRVTIALDLISEMILSYGLYGVLFIGIYGFIYRWLYFFFITNRYLFYRFFFVGLYYSFTLNFWTNTIIGDTMLFYKMLLVFFVIYLLLKWKNRKNNIVKQQISI